MKVPQTFEVEIFGRLVKRLDGDQRRALFHDPSLEPGVAALALRHSLIELLQRPEGNAATRSRGFRQLLSVGRSDGTFLWCGKCQ